MNGDIPDSSPLGSLLQSFFTEHLLSHRRASQQTVDSYRDTFRLLLRFLRDSAGHERRAGPVSQEQDDNGYAQ